jgi:anti-sigma factor RsiW
MKRLCDLFNRYRDGTLDPDQEIKFESHLANCEECQPRLVFLNNLVDVIRNQEMPNPVDPPERIADLAFDQARSWDIFLPSWLKPLPVWSGLVLMLIIIALFWGAPAQQLSFSTDYEELLVNGGLNGSVMANLSDAELESWLEQGGTIK